MLGIKRITGAADVASEGRPGSWVSDEAREKFMAVYERAFAARWLDSPMMLQPELITLMWAGIRGYHAEPKFPAILTDEELRAITVPALMVTGARSALITPAQARDRASHMPHADVAVVPGNHGGFDRIDELNDRIAAFIKAHAAANPPPRPTATAH